MGAWCGLGQESRYRDQARVINNGYRDELRDFGCAKLKLSALAWVQSPNALVLGLVVSSLGKLVRPGGIKALVAENLLLKHQLLILRRAWRRAPNLRFSDRFLFGSGS